MESELKRESLEAGWAAIDSAISRANEAKADLEAATLRAEALRDSMRSGSWAPLAENPGWATCPDCGGTGDLGINGNGKTITCEACGGDEDRRGSGTIPLRPAPAPPEERGEARVPVGRSQLSPGEWEWCPDHREWIDGKWIKPQKGSLVVSESWDRFIIIDRLDTYDAHALTLGTPILPEEAVEGDYFRGPREQDFTDWRIANMYALNVRSHFAWLRPHAPTEPADLPLPYQAEAIARGEMAERLRVAEARVAMLERAARWALGEGDSDFPGPYAGYGAIGWRVKFRALLEGAQP